MTDRLLTAALLLSLLLMQGLSTLHRGSSNPSAHNSIHERLFAPIETLGHTSLNGLRPKQPEQSQTAPDAGRNCDLLDHLLGTNGPSSQIAFNTETGLKPAAVQLALPIRISRFQQIGPPVRGPPHTLS